MVREWYQISWVTCPMVFMQVLRRKLVSGAKGNNLLMHVLETKIYLVQWND
jgi:hypothetical protein